MKRCILVVILSFFTLHSVVFTAWANPCMVMSVPQANQFMQEDMPCHDNSSERSHVTHCEGICLCLYISVQPSILHDVVMLSTMHFKSMAWPLVHEAPIFGALTQPYHPPKQFS